MNGHLLRRDELRGREIGAARDRQPAARLAAGERHDRRQRRPLRVGAEERDGLAVAGDDRVHSIRVPLVSARAAPTVHRHLEEMAPIDIVRSAAGVRAVDDEAAVGRQRACSTMNGPASAARPGRRARMVDRVEMRPAVPIGHEHEAVVRLPSRGVDRPRDARIRIDLGVRRSSRLRGRMPPIAASADQNRPRLRLRDERRRGAPPRLAGARTRSRVRPATRPASSRATWTARDTGSAGPCR